MAFKDIIFEKREGVAKIILNRPGALNALSPNLICEIISALDDVEGDDEIMAVVISAKGKVFCAGADLFAIKKLMLSQAKIEGFIRLVEESFSRIENFIKPVICAVHGMALAGGLELVNTCDIVIASDDARLGDQHVNRGLIPGGGNSQRLPRLVGPRKAKEILLTGEWISAAEAERIGLVNKVVPADKLDEAVNEMVGKIITNKSSLAAKRIKKLVNEGMQVDIERGIELEIQNMINHFASYDGQEGVKSFEEKRPPKFKGK